MKYFLLFLLILNSAFGAYISESSIGQENKKFYTNKRRCENAEKQKCHAWKREFISGAVKLDFIMVDDPTKPILSRREKVTSCANLEACNTMLRTFKCAPEFSDYQVGYDKDQLRLYCIKNLGFEKVLSTKKYLVKDDTKHAQKLSEKAAAKAKADGLATVRKNRIAGQKVIDLMLLRNASKNLTGAQRKQMLAAYEVIKSLLEVGSLSQAKIEIQAVTPDGVLVTGEDKSALIAEIDKHI